MNQLFSELIIKVNLYLSVSRILFKNLLTSVWIPVLIATLVINAYVLYKFFKLK